MLPLANEFRNFINENFLFGQAGGGLSDDDSLLEKGIIDSTGVLELIGFIERTYGVKVEEPDLIPENLDSIANLVRFVERKRAKAAAGGPLC
jgi:acyl carrier protein